MTVGPTTLVSAGNTDIFLAKYSPSIGQWVWGVQAGGPSQDYCNSISIGRGSDRSGLSIYLSGSFSNTVRFGDIIKNVSHSGTDFYVAHYFIPEHMQEGTWQWVQHLGNNSVNQAFSIAVDNSNVSLYLSGYYTGTIQFNSKLELTSASKLANAFVAKFDLISEQWVWVSGAVGMYESIARYLTLDAGSVYVSGYFFGNVTFGQIELTSKTDENSDIWLARINCNTGEWIWVVSAGGSGKDEGNSVVVSGSHVFMTGSFSISATFGSVGNSSNTKEVIGFGGTDVFVAKYNIHSGDCIWVSVGGGSSLDSGNAIAVVPRFNSTNDISKAGFMYDQDDQEILVVGHYTMSYKVRFGNYSLSSRGLRDVFIAKYDPSSGECLWVLTAGGPSMDQARAIASYSNSLFFVSGDFTGSAEFGKHSIRNDLGDVATSIFTGEYYTGFTCGDDIPAYRTAIVCSGHGECISQNNCSCHMGYTGQNCETLITCFGVEALDNSSHVCSGNGDCISPDTCSCFYGYSGQECQFVSCFGVNSTDDSTVCSSHGDCIAPDTCNCTSNYVDPRCSTPVCYGLNSTDKYVCSSHGICVAPDTCNCTMGYVGEQCSVPQCFGINATDDFVCNSWGVCESYNKCVCKSGYRGDSCGSAPYRARETKIVLEVILIVASIGIIVLIGAIVVILVMVRQKQQVHKSPMTSVSDFDMTETQYVQLNNEL